MAVLDTLGTEQIIRIVASGGSVRISYKLGTEQIIRIVASLRKEARLVVEDSAKLGTEQIIRIAAAGRGAVTFE